MSNFSPNEKLAIKLAGEALRAAVQDDHDQAVATLKQLGDQTGGEGVGLALMAWCDTLLAQVDLDPGKPVRLAFKEVNSGRIGSADDVPATVAWAGQMLSARRAEDEQMWLALMDAIPEDPQQVGEYVGAMLQFIATNLKPFLTTARTET